jgi:hypothetical protein
MLYHSLFSLLSPYNTAHAGLLQCDRMEHTRKPLLPHQGGSHASCLLRSVRSDALDRQSP